MALKPCRECGKEVSTGAKTCPHCGVASPAVKHYSLSPKAGCGATVVGIVLLVILMRSCGDSAAHRRTGDAFMAASNCERAVRARLKAPSTAKFPSSGQQVKSDAAGNAFSVRGLVDSQNSFGAVLRRQYMCIVTYDTTSKVYTVTDAALGK